MTKELLISWLESKEWKKDAYGNYKKGRYRMKLNERACRLDLSYRNYENKLMWTRLKSGYYSKLHISENDKLSGMKRGI